jgi:CDP-glycerol glycerophosphotransferase (TagB/SpsB family)
MIKILKKIIHKILPVKVDKRIKKISFNLYHIKKIQLNHKIAIKKVRNKEKIKVVFFALHSGVWKYDRLYSLMMKHPNFEPSVLVCPVINYGKENMLQEMDTCYKMLKDKNYKVLRSYDTEKNIYVNVKKTLQPDIIFYTNPYGGIIDDRYYITKFPDILTCYVPYSSMIIQSETQFNKHLCNLLWKSFVENNYSYEMSKKYMTNKGQNVVISGFPSLDLLLDKSYHPKNIWIHNQKIKIIWAPHHTIEGTESINFSNFLHYADIMIELAQKYQKDIQIAFKPHPLLYIKLCKIWGKIKTDTYFKKWIELPNTQFENGDYIDLFLTSDAMIFDSCSFLNEYLYTRKPSIFITNDVVKSQLNDYGLDALDCHQQAFTEKDIIEFIESLINNNIDPKALHKQHYYEKYIAMFDEKSASERVISEIYTAIYGNN